MKLSECLRSLGCNLAYLVTLREEYYSDFKTREKNSKGSSQAARTREAEYQSPGTRTYKKNTKALYRASKRFKNSDKLI